ncbi:hypothetical protein HB852_15455 [Listeria grandensis]|uniref:hypothetical protein n=1 Tax=Listeria grandensis TaxID=1494963 RepID=UPI001626396D|nr:hypothetical protein [Listeria grandensis]MBC1476013.1 hypothetical protein [Listeria grandensis]
MVLKSEDIKEYVEKIGYKLDPDSAIWGTSMPSGFSYALFGSVSVLDMNYNVLQMNETEIIVIPVSNTSGKISQGDFLVIPEEDVESVKFKKGMLGFTLEILTSQGELKFKVRKAMLGASWHKENLGNVLMKFEQ